MIMTLGDAIRLGALNRPQAFGPFGWPDESCALQAALDAIGRIWLVTSTFNPNVTYPDYERTRLVWPWITETQIELCPLISTCGLYRRIRVVERSLNVYDAIIHLNDYHMKSRQWIAEWVDSVDPTRTANQERMITTTQQIERDMVANPSSS